MNWFLTNIRRALMFGLVIVFVLTMYIMITACGNEPQGGDPNMDGTYATANARINEMQTAISIQETEYAINHK